MRRFTALVTACVATVAFCAAASAADAPWPRPEVIKPLAATEFASGWYIRGDIGYRAMQMGGIEGAVPVTSSSYENVFGVGGGAGYKWGFFRTDLTLDYGLRGRAAGDTATVPETSYSAKIDSFTVLANVYLDLGTWFGLTPYVGVGGGMSRLNITDFRYPSTATAALESSETWNGSWAWMAGLSYLITPNFAIDVGYRYLNLGNAKSSPNSLGQSTNFGKFTANEIRIGFRLLID